MKKASLLILAGVALMACTPADETAPAASTETASTPTTEPAPPTATPAPPSTDPAADTCNMAQYATLVGKPSTDAGVPPASATVRIIKPGDQVTMDFQATRLNIEVGADGTITAVRCG
jgi:glucose/arabinose dehydrogenase